MAPTASSGWTRADGSINTVTLGAFKNIKAERLAWSYDAAGSPVALTGAGAYVSDVTRDALGRARRYVYGNTFGAAVWQTLTWQPGTGRLMSAQVDRQSQDLTDSLTSWAYDTAGNPTSVTVDAPGTASDETQCYRYDALRQLTAAWTPAGGTCSTAGNAPTELALAGPAPYGATWSFDTAGNRQEQTMRIGGGTPATTTTAYGYVNTGGPHRPTTATSSGASTGTSTFTYDGAGNTKTRAVPGKPTQTLTWDGEGHLASVTDSTGTIEANWYDPDGALLVRRNPVAGTSTLFLGDTQITVAGIGTATRTTSWKRYYSFDGQTVAVRTGNTMNDVQILITDPQNTATTQIHTGAAASLNTRRALPYGATRSSSTTGFAGGRSFVGGTEDPTTGLIHIGARDYDPATGRFISIDPVLSLHDPQQVGGYAYAANNPITYSDPTGECIPVGDVGSPCYNPENDNMSPGQLSTGDRFTGGTLADYGQAMAGLGHLGHATTNDIAALNRGLSRDEEWARRLATTIRMPGGIDHRGNPTHLGDGRTREDHIRSQEQFSFSAVTPCNDSVCFANEIAKAAVSAAQSRITLGAVGALGSATRVAPSAKTPYMLTNLGGNTYKSPAGLIFEPGSAHGHRLVHVLQHSFVDPTKKLHTVFSSRTGALRTVDEAWARRGLPDAKDAGKYVIPMGRKVGTNGESNVTIIVRPGTSRIVTAYPS